MSGGGGDRSRFTSAWVYMKETMSSFVEWWTPEPNPTPRSSRRRSRHISPRRFPPNDGPDLFFPTMASSLDPSNHDLAPDLPKAKGIMVADVRLGCSMRELNAILFGPGSDFAIDMHRRKKHRDYQEGAWTRGEEVEGGSLRRMLTFVVPGRRLIRSEPHQSVRLFRICLGYCLPGGYSCSEVQEYLVIHPGLVVVHCVSRTPEVPAGECFTTETQYVLQAQGPGSVRLRISLALSFYRWTPLKRVLCRGAAIGARAGFRKSLEVLQEHVALEVQRAGRVQGSARSAATRQRQPVVRLLFLGLRVGLGVAAAGGAVLAVRSARGGQGGRGASRLRLFGGRRSGGEDKGSDGTKPAAAVEEPQEKKD